MAWIAGVLVGGLTLLWIAWNLSLDALWQPTDRETVHRILFLAEIEPGNRVVDLGCGDGRFVVAAARDHDAEAVGVEIDPFRVLWARAWVRLAGLSGRARIVHANMYDYDVTGADVVILFLSATSNFRLQTRLRNQLAPGARVVSYYHPMWGWSPSVVGEAKAGHPIYVYRIGGDLGVPD
jgi:SAM-dependent methyltransferase